MEMEAGNRNVFWGLVIKPGKRYETEVQEPFRITKACIEPATAKDGKVTSVYVECDNNEEFIIANLNLKNFNEGLDLSFNEGEKICFKVDGPGTVHLTGNLLDDPPPGDMFDMDDSEDDSEAMEDSEEETVDAGDKIKEVSDKEAKKLKRKQEQPEVVKKKKAKVVENGDSTIDTTLGDLDDTDNFAEEEDSDEDDDSDDDSDSEEANTTAADTTAADDSDDDDDDDDDSSEEEEEDEKAKSKKTKESPKKKDAKEEAKTPKSEKKQENGKAPKQESKTPKQETKTPKNDSKTPKAEGKTPKQESKTPKQDAKTPKQDTKTPKQEAKTPKQDPKTPKDDSKTPGKTPKRTIKGGIQVEDLKEGSGPECTQGATIGMYYEGRLKTNNKKFDGLKDGAPFKFKLGKGQVIKGWDLGVMGMKVGGKRRLTIPPKFAYGADGAPPSIPPNSTLVFDIECKFVK